MPPPSLVAKFLTPRQIAQLSQLSYRTVIRLIAGGELQGTKLGSQWRVLVEDYDDWVEKGRS